jgi:ATP-dependent helicase/DNAse subunit B
MKQGRLFKIRPYILNKGERQEIKKQIIEESGLREELKQQALDNIGKSEKEIKKEKQLSIENVKQKIIEVLKREQAELYDTGIVISYSKLTTYRGCPFAYFLEYELHLPKKKPPNVKVGEAFHQVLADFNRGNLNTLEELIEGKEIIENGKKKKILGWRGRWSQASHDEDVYFKDERERYIIFNEVLRKGEELLKKFYEREKGKPRTSPFIEYEFTEPVDVNGNQYLLNGKIDKIDTATTPTKIIEYKTGDFLSKNTKDFGLQLTIYYLFYKKIFYKKMLADHKIIGSAEPDIVVYGFSFSKCEIEEYHTARSSTDVDYLEQQIKLFLDGLKSRNFVPFVPSPRFDHCKKCNWNRNDFCRNLLYSNNKEIFRIMQDAVKKY